MAKGDVTIQDIYFTLYDVTDVHSIVYISDYLVITYIIMPKSLNKDQIMKKL